MIYLIEEHHHDIDGWYTDTYAIFENMDKMLAHIRTEIDNDHTSDWLNYDWFFSVYEVKDPLLNDKVKINYLEELYKKYPDVADLVLYDMRKERESWDNVGTIGELVVNAMATAYLIPKLFKKND